MKIAQPIHPFLISNFEEFYLEILKFKQKIINHEQYKEALEENNSVDQKTPLSLPFQDQLAFHIQQKLRGLLEKQLLQIQKNMGESTATHSYEAQYAMVALADEIFLNLNWGGKKQWEKSLLEAQLFKTQIAGEYIYQKIDQLLQSNDPIRTDMAMIYLLILGLGFQGQYKGWDDTHRLKWYKDELYKVVHQELPPLFEPVAFPLQPDCYRHTMSEPALCSLPDMRFWGSMFVVTLLGYLLISIMVWYNTTQELEEAINRIFEQAKAMML